jgi:hypothetical protein
MVVSGLAMSSLMGFRAFVGCIVIWILMVGIKLTRQS